MENLDIQCYKVLQNTPLTVFKECLHACINDMCGRKSTSYESFKSVTNWTLEEYKIVTSGIKQLVIEAVISQKSTNEIKDTLSELDTSRQEAVLECLSVRHDDVRKMLIQEKCAVSGSMLRDFDWKVKWVMGSSKMASLREPLLTLDLHLTEGRHLWKCDDETSQKTVSLELDKEELNRLILVLEKAQESVSSWQT